MLRCAIMLAVVVALCYAEYPGNHGKRGPGRRNHNSRRRPAGKLGTNLNLQELADIPNAAELRDSMTRTQATLRRRMDAVRDWPRLREQRREDHGDHHDDPHHHHRDRDDERLRGRPWEHRTSVHGMHDGAFGDRPRATGAGMGHVLDGLFDGLTDIMGPIMDLDLDLGLDFDWLPGRRQQPWYHGENVCESREEKEEDLNGEIERHQVTTSTVCDELESAYKCTVSMNVYGKKTTVTVTYKCCYGFTRVEGKSGCPKEQELAGLAETADKLGLQQLFQAVRSVGLHNALAQGNFSVFAPTDEALIKLQPKDMPVSNMVMVSPELVDEASQLRELLLAHLLPGFVPTTAMEDEQLYVTLYPDATVRVNHYSAPVKMTTANCVRVTSSDHLATNGVLHMVERVLPTVTDHMLDIVAGNPQLRTLSQLIDRTGLSDVLRGPGQYTLFAPTDEAFRRLNRDTRDYLLQANTCLKKALQSHLLPNVICSAVIQSRGRTLNTLGNYIQLNRTADAAAAAAEQVYVEGGALVTEADIMATNGVIHLIDDVIITKQVMNIVEMAREVGATAVLELVQKAGLTKTLRELDDFTMFLPTNEAIESLPAATLEALSRDGDLLRDVLRYHVVPRDIRARDLHNDLHIDTLLGEKKQITVKEYSSFPFSLKTVKTVQCAPLTAVDIESCNALAHVVSKVLLPPAGDLMDVLAQDARFSYLVAAAKAAGIADTLQLGRYTVFAPTNQAFEAVDQALLRELSNNKEKMKAFLAHHITHDALCCSGMSIHSSLGWFWKPVEMTLDTGSNVVFQRRRDNTILVDGTPIVTCDLTATNGVVHAIDRFLPSAAAKYGLELRPVAVVAGDAGSW